jgi:hypothetical protein
MSAEDLDILGFNWGSLGLEWWANAKTICGATALQTRFACGRHRGLSKTLAAKQAGYSEGNKDGAIRQAGSRVSGEMAVMRLLAMAQAETGTGDGGTVTRTESKQVLSRMIRNSDPSIRIAAITALEKIEAAEREDHKTPDTIDPLQALRDMADISPELSVLMAAESGIAFEPTEKQRAAYSERIAQIARQWILEHRQEVQQILDGAPMNGAVTQSVPREAGN